MAGARTLSAEVSARPIGEGQAAAKDQDWFCDGIAEEILNALAGLKGLSVAARASAFSFRGKGDDLKALGDKLNVTTVLDGSVRRAGDQLRVTVRLSDVANGYQLWSERYDRRVNDIFDVQDEIAKAVAARLRVTLGDDPASLPKVIRHTENQKAYHLYLRGRHHWYSRRKDALEKSKDCFEEAIRLDPEYALAYVGLADLYTVQGIYAYAPESEVGPKARAAVERALAINGELADAYRALGFIQIFIDWDVRAAEQTLQRALALDPASALSYAWLGWPTWPGREEVAMRAARRAQELDPLNPYINTLVGAVHDFWGHTEEGLEQGLQALDVDSNPWSPSTSWPACTAISAGTPKRWNSSTARFRCRAALPSSWVTWDGNRPSQARPRKRGRRSPNSTSARRPNTCRRCFPRWSTRHLERWIAPSNFSRMRFEPATVESGVPG